MSQPHDELQQAIDCVAEVRVNPATFPRKAPLAFRRAAVELLNQIARLRFRMDGGDLEELDELGVEDETFTVDLHDLREFVVAFHKEGDQPRYAACAAVLDWALAQHPEDK